jgi:hypothetical protein
VSTDALAAAIAAEEHRQGRPYAADPEHCETCAEVDRAWMQATCKHRYAVEITRIEDPRQRWLCIHCSHMWLDEPSPAEPLEFP